MSQPQRPDLDARIDALYGLPLGEFTAERDALARGLRKEGDREAADAVRGLGKPSAAAWVVNQLARRHADDVTALLEAGKGLRRAHEAAMAGAGAPALTTAAEAERRAVGTLMERARQVGGEDGSGPSEATLTRVRDTLRAAAADEEARELIAQGRLTRERQAVGLGPFGLGAPAAAQRRPAPAPAPAEAPEPGRRSSREVAADRERARRLAEARKAVDAARRDAEAARTALEEREEEGRRARAERERAEAGRDEARKALEGAEAAVAAARAGEADARNAARFERRRRDAAEAALAAAEAEAERLEGDEGG